ncbi:hypothetical protein B0H21DRAFT_509825 [Amylocystis lapponica]|nr:hypothetical protein B0H21DRAFT_509825 [Amylocystis lapponica]
MFQFATDEIHQHFLSRAPATSTSRATLELAALLSYGDGSANDLSFQRGLREHENWGHGISFDQHTENVTQWESLNVIPPVNPWLSFPQSNSFDSMNIDNDMGNDPAKFYGGPDPVQDLPTTDDINYCIELSPALPASSISPSAALTTTIIADPLLGEAHRCTWCTDGVLCCAPLEDASPAGVLRHLKDSHLPTDSHPKVRTRCAWHEDGAPCSASKDFEFVSLGKHIAAVHLKTTACVCGVCARAFTRGDSLRRHMKNMHAEV